MNLAPGQVPDLPMGIAVQFSLMPGHTADMCWWEHVVCKEEASEEGNPSLASDAVGAPPASLPSSPLLDLSYFMVRVFLSFLRAPLWSLHLSRAPPQLSSSSLPCPWVTESTSSASATASIPPGLQTPACCPWLFLPHEACRHLLSPPAPLSIRQACCCQVAAATSATPAPG